MSVIAALWAVAMMTKPGRVGYVYVFYYTEYYIGVLTLVSLSITIMVGLVSTDRLVLSIRQRVLLQSAHRTTGVIAVTSLVLHVWMKVVEKHASLIDVFIPFLQPGQFRVWIGFGTISGWVMMLVMWTGIARSRFVGRGSPWMWRGIHSISYLIWPIALLHGLNAGRPAATWVVVSYIVCVLGVLVGLAVRLSVSLNRRKDFSSTAASGGLKPVGSLVPTTSPALKRPSRRARPAPVEPQTLGPVAVVDSFRPAANPVTAPPLAPPPMDEDLVAPRQRRARAEEMYDEPTGMMPQYDEDRPRRGRRVEEEIEYDEPRGRRYPGEDTSTRMRRPELEDTGARMRRDELEDTGARMRRPGPDETGTRMRVDDTGTRMRRPGPDETGTRMRRDELENTGARMRRDDYEEPAPRRRRYAEEEEPAPRSRRRGDMPLSEEPLRSGRDEYDEVPRQRGGRYADARYADDYEVAPPGRRGEDSGRHSRAGFVDGDGYVEADDSPTLVDMAPRRRGRDEPPRVDAGRAGRRGGRGRDDDAAEDGYWSQLRGEAN
ncbi:translation initiation factor III [Paractinoplanes hotanensis]|uniref:Translation initiation factor III n=1 Tax=Paractinoplanes hotanensis TaxID=2906497 RepID=A0ABT0YDG8_9ACTN|nr:translation initiation factor III [Actinoplanes hotanensis]MCM4084091.1 translation initiation factor III [Actinoplanes hotanensis]